MVQGEGALEPVRGDVTGIPVSPGVVDQHIDPGKALQHLAGQPPHLRLPDVRGRPGSRRAVIIDDRRSGGTTVSEHETGNPTPADATPRR